MTDRETLPLPFLRAKAPLVVALGVGRNSVAVLVGLAQRGMRPDAILFADTGSERPQTYTYLYSVLPKWLESVGFPQVTIVRFSARDFKHWPPYFNLEENLLTNRTLPSIAYGSSSCSAKHKISPQAAWLKSWQPARDCWASGGRVIQAIGFEDSSRDHQRAKGCNTFAVQKVESDRFELWYPLQDWCWNLSRCIQEIEAAGLPVPEKSSCYFCTGMKPWEVEGLSRKQLARIVIIEARANQRNLDYAESKGWPAGEGKPITQGLWRREVKGLRKGSVARPGSMTQFIREKGLLPEAMVDRLIALTPTRDLFRGEIPNWQDWLDAICEQAERAEDAPIAATLPELELAVAA